MSFKKNGGFTLVELIVVIAILGLLAGIGVPMYSQYVEKAQIEVEEQQIAMYHNAYVVACVGNSIDPEGYTPSLDWRDGNFYGLTAIQQRAGENPAANAVAEFNAFFGFDGSKFYSFKHKSQAEVADGIENGVEGAETRAAYKQVLDKLLSDGNKDNLSNLMNSIWGQNDAEFLTGKVDWTSDIASAMLAGNPDGSFNDMITNCGPAMMEFMGITDPAKQMEKAKELAITKMEQMIAANPERYAGLNAQDIYNKHMDENAEAPSSTEAELFGAAQNSIAVNNAILAAAKNSGSASSSIINTLTSGNPTSTLVSKINSAMNSETPDTSAVMGEVALTYAMYMSYAERNNIQVDDVQDVLDGLDDDGFQAYVRDDDKSGNFQKDMDGYLSSMNMINSSVQGNEDAVTDVVLNGFGSNNLNDILQQAMDSTKKSN